MTHKTRLFGVCFNTQPPEGGWFKCSVRCPYTQRFNTQPPEGGWFELSFDNYEMFKFQHTAARRRLERVVIAQKGV